MPAGEAGSAPLDLGDLVGLGAAGSHDLHGRALLLADQRARQRRGDGDAALLGIGFGLADDLPYRLLLGVFVDQRDGGAEHDGVAGELRDVDDVGARELVFDLGDAAFIVRLLFLGGVIFRVLRKVAVRARLGDVLDDARTVLRLPLLQFDLQGGIAARSHRNLFHHLFRPSIVRAAAARARDTLVDFDSGLPARNAGPASLLIFGPVRGPTQHPNERWVPGHTGFITNR